MPENWKKYKLKNICEKISVGFVGTISNDYTGEKDGVPILRSKNVRSGKIDYNDLKFINKTFHLKHKKSRLIPGDIVIVRVGQNRGDVCKVPDTFPELNVANCVFLRPPKEYSSFLEIFLRSDDGRNLLLSISSGSAQLVLNTGDIAELEVLLPEKKEALAIAEIINSLDLKIELNLQMNKTLEEMASALYKHWFVDFGPFREGKFVESELGMIPEGWEVKTIGELYNTTSGGTPSRKKPEYYNDGDINWVKSKELYGNFIIDTEEKINHLGLKKSSAKIIPPKSVLLAMYGATVGESSILSIEATCNQAICAIIEKELSFVYVFLYIRIFKADILNQATGSAQQNISQQIIKNISIISPPIGLKVFNELEQYYALIEQNVFENQTLTSLRDTLLPRLISGEVRVKEAEKILTDAL